MIWSEPSNLLLTPPRSFMKRIPATGAFIPASSAIVRLLMSIAGALAVFASTGSTGHAAFLFTLQQVAGNVVATGSGTFNTSALTLATTASAGAFVDTQNSVSFLSIGPTGSSSVDEYTGISGPTSFGSGGTFTNASSGSGNTVELNNVSGLSLYVPHGYVSNTFLSNTATFSSQTFSSLGLTPGIYTYDWGSTGAGTADSLTLDVVPEPSVWAMLLGGVASLLLFRRRR